MAIQRTFFANRDASLKRRFDNNVDAGAGNAPTLVVGPVTAGGTGWKGRALVRFGLDFANVSQPSSIASASLRLKVAPDTCATRGEDTWVRVRRVTSPWTPGTFPGDGSCGWSPANAIVFGDYSTAQADEVFIQVPQTTGEWTDIPILPIVRTWFGGAPNNGIEIAAANAGGSTNEEGFDRTVEFEALGFGEEARIVVSLDINLPPSATLDSPTMGVTVEGGNAYSGTATADPSVVPTIRVKFTPDDPDPSDRIDRYIVFYAVEQGGIIQDSHSHDSGTGMALVPGQQVTHDLDVSAHASRGETVLVWVKVYDLSGVSYTTVAVWVRLNAATMPVITQPAQNGHVARLEWQAGAGWTYPRLYVGWDYADPNGDPQKRYRVNLYADSGGAAQGWSAASGGGSPLFTTGWVMSTATLVLVAYSGIQNGVVYHISVETEDAHGLSMGNSAARRTKPWWGQASYFYDIGTTPTQWSATPTAVAGANQRVIVEHGSSASATPPSTWYASLGNVPRRRFYHYRVTLLTWGSATPGSPSLSSITLSYSTTVTVPDHWEALLPPTATDAGLFIDISTLVYGHQSIHFIGGADAASRGRTRQLVHVRPDTDYILSAFLKAVGSPSFSIAAEDVDGDILADETGQPMQVTANATQDWTRHVSGVWNSGGTEQVYVAISGTSTDTATEGFADAIKLEASRVVTPWTPGFVSGRGAVTIDAGGLQVDGSSEGVFRLRSPDGSVTRLVDDGLDVGGFLSTAALRIDGVVTPAQITADQDDYWPGGGSASVWRLSSDASRTITGILEPDPPGTMLHIFNVGSQDIVLAHESASSSPDNRLRLRGSTNATIAAQGSITLWHDPTSSRWRQTGS